MASEGNETRRMARQALNELVAVRQDKVGAIERRLEALEAHVQSLTQRYEVPAYPVGRTPAANATQKGLHSVGPAAEAKGNCESRRPRSLPPAEEAFLHDESHQQITTADHGQCVNGGAAGEVVNVGKKQPWRRISYPHGYKRQSRVDSFFKPCVAPNAKADEERRVTPVSYVMARRDVPFDKTIVVPAVQISPPAPTQSLRTEQEQAFGGDASDHEDVLHHQHQEEDEERRVTPVSYVMARRDVPFDKTIVVPAVQISPPAPTHSLRTEPEEDSGGEASDHEDLLHHQEEDEERRVTPVSYVMARRDVPLDRTIVVPAVQISPPAPIQSLRTEQEEDSGGHASDQEDLLHDQEEVEERRVTPVSHVMARWDAPFDRTIVVPAVQSSPPAPTQSLGTEQEEHSGGEASDLEDLLHDQEEEKHNLQLVASMATSAVTWKPKAAAGPAAVSRGSSDSAAPVSHLIARRDVQPCDRAIMDVPRMQHISQEEDCGTTAVAVTWKPRAARIAVSSSSSDSLCSSGEASTDDEEEVSTTPRQHVEVLPVKAKSKGVTVQQLPPDACIEDRFDWIVLGAVNAMLWPERFASLPHHVLPPGLKHRDLPLEFENEVQYGKVFQPLIVEECRAIFQMDWEKIKKDMGLKRSSDNAYKLPRAQGYAGVWRLQDLRNQDRPFCSVQGYQQSGGPAAEHGELVLLACRHTLEIRALALVHNVFDDAGALLRTREVWDKCPEQCFMLRVSNMITMKRMYTAVSSLSLVYAPIRSQVLNPRRRNVMFHTEAAFLQAWAAENRFNNSQLSAISAAVNLRQGFLLVQGPPGTGKTTTIVGMVSALLIKEPGIRILLCAGSNPALDEVVYRLMLHGLVDRHGKRQRLSPGAIVRVGPKNKVRKDCLDVYLDHVRLRQTDAPTKALATEWTIKTASIVCSTLSGCRHPQLDELKFNFNVVIVDEAAQAAEAEVIIALKKVADRCILVGDPRQLAATVMQQPGTAFGRSLFERMQAGGAAVHLLNTQYRMHPDISHFPCRHFYDGAVEDAEQVRRMAPIFRWHTRHQWVSAGGYDFELGRLCFLDVAWGRHSREGGAGATSLLNREEASVVCAIVRGVLGSLVEPAGGGGRGGGRDDDAYADADAAEVTVGVITPYAAQKKTIVEELARAGVSSRRCEVDTVDGFQGREKDVVVVSCVRAADGAGGGGVVGFLADPRRVCVALTRAKHALIVVGHARTLERHQLWRSLIRSARDRKCFKSLLRS